MRNPPSSLSQRDISCGSAPVFLERLMQILWKTIRNGLDTTARDQIRKSARYDHVRKSAKAHTTARVGVQIALDATVGTKSIKNARRDGERKVSRTLDAMMGERALRHTRR